MEINGPTQHLVRLTCVAMIFVLVRMFVCVPVCKHLHNMGIYVQWGGLSFKSINTFILQAPMGSCNLQAPRVWGVGCGVLLLLSLVVTQTDSYMSEGAR